MGYYFLFRFARTSIGLVCMLLIHYNETPFRYTHTEKRLIISQKTPTMCHISEERSFYVVQKCKFQNDLRFSPISTNEIEDFWNTWFSLMEMGRNKDHFKAFISVNYIKRPFFWYMTDACCLLWNNKSFISVGEQ